MSLVFAAMGFGIQTERLPYRMWWLIFGPGSSAGWRLALRIVILILALSGLLSLGTTTAILDL
jgi:hypothetical protein